MDAKSLLSAYQDAVNRGASQWLVPYEPSRSAERHQFVFFLKPEITLEQEGVDREAILSMILEKLGSFGVETGAVRLLSGPVLKSEEIMDRHYGVINRISKQGRAALAASAEEALTKNFAEELTAGAPVLGGHEFLASYPDFSALALCTLNDNLGTARLGGGSYVMKAKVLGQTVLVLNPFHAYQLIPFTSDGRGIMVMEGISDTPWATLRQELIGATNPSKAVAGSIRRTLLDEKDRFGLADVDQGTNGVHLSAGPLEGLVELCRFFSDAGTGKQLAASDTSFGRVLGKSGLSGDQMEALTGNPSLMWEGAEVSAFDLTEELDAVESAVRLKTALAG